MRRVRILIVAALIGVLACAATAGERDDLWNQVDKAIDSGLPKTAIDLLEQIIPGALEDEAWAEATKAIGLQIVYEDWIQGRNLETAITRLEAEIATAPEAMKPVMEAILAHWFWQYFELNRYRFVQRTASGEASGEDFTTWDLARILTEIDTHFTAALAAEDQLKAIRIAEWDDLLEGGTTPDTYRPTLYDFLAHEALSFYSAGEQAALGENAFEIMADSPIFSPVAEFLAWDPVTTDTDSVLLKAIRLYQDLLRYHQNDADETAFVDADLHRLAFGYNQAVGEKDDLYMAALERFADEWEGNEIAARAIYAWASVLYDQGEYVKARTLAEQGWKVYPASYGGTQCYNLIQTIEGKSASIKTERVWNDPLPEIQVTYRNVTPVYFRAVRWDDLSRPSWGNLSSEQRAAVLAATPALAWSAELPATADYQTRTEILPAPDGLEKGQYFLIASHDASFSDRDNQVSVAPVWVSDLALVVRTLSQEGAVEGFVLDAGSGLPIAGAKVTRWMYNSTSNGYEPADDTQSDDSGMFRFAPEATRWVHFLIVAQHGDDQLTGASTYTTTPGYDDPSAYEQTVFFTDRSIYRPGQTVQYKGICIRVDQAKDSYQTLSHRQLTVVFWDTNGQEIARQTHTCNDYGSFSGSFTAPEDRLTGRMSLAVTGGPDGSTSISVEEYKRPKFYVELTPPEEAPRLNEQVVVPGVATAYTGASIGGAEVEWRVVRGVRYPAWAWWSRWYATGTSQQIAHGTAVTASDGSFSIEFTAKPDLSVLEEDEPVFQYTVYADVTDTSGETRSANRTVSAGYTALQATVSAADWQTPASPVEFTITTESLDGEPEPAQGTVRIYALKEPEAVVRPLLFSGSSRVNASDPQTWELAGLVDERAFTTDATGWVAVSTTLGAGAYRAVLETQDRFGKAVTAQETITVVDPEATDFAVRIPNYFEAPTWSVEPGETFMAVWGTGYDAGRAYVEIECRGEVLRAWWTESGRTQETITQEVTESMRGGFTLRVTYVRENRAYVSQQIVNVPWTNKDLSISWEHFTSLLEPGQRETWTAVITGEDARKAVAEMVAGLYDASLDQYLAHDWLHTFSGFRAESSRLSSQFENRAMSFSTIYYGWSADYLSASLTYRHFPDAIVTFYYSYWSRGGTGGATRGGGTPEASTDDSADFADGAKTNDEEVAADSSVDLSTVTARTNLNETAFFFPHLVSDSEGVVRMEFTMPEALTEWKFLGFAHDTQMRRGYLTGTTVTAKDLMVEPNPPRFVREGDVIEFTVKVTNQSAARVQGRVALTMSDAWTLESRDEALGNNTPERDFDVPSKESRTLSWRLTIPDGCEFLIYKAVGATTRLSDGQEGYLPVLSRRILVTESLPLPIRGPQTKEFEFTKLLQSGASDSLIHQSLTVQMVSQPVWYAVMALPYLMEYPYECSEQIFNRLYANSLAAYIANSDPKIRRIFDQWKATPALDSPLEKNEDLKSVTLEETPWVRQAISESEARRNVGILFDENRLSSETSNALFKLKQMQYSDGLWPWFPGCSGSEYITLYITTGFGRLRHLGVDTIDVSCAVKALNALDAWMYDWYHYILKYGDPNEDNLSPTIALYLYGRSFFLADQAIADEYQDALDFWLAQARTYWLSLWRQSQAHLAIALKRFGDTETPAAIMKSIKEFSVTDEELGMFWRDTERSWWWHRAPIETQALMIEAFDEVMGDAQAVEDCRVWLLKQKQTQDWNTTKATADAIYGLLLRGTDMLSSNALVEVALGGVWIEPEDVEAGTGFYEERFVRSEIEPEMGRITVKKVDDGVSWGSVHWQYLEDMSKVTPYEGTPLTLSKAIYIKETTSEGEVLVPVAGPVSVGDELVVRIVLKVDRDMEYVHMKDQRGSGTEPVNVLSRYRYQDGLAYYESTRDTATHFFMDYLPKGTYVFEYSSFIQLKGEYQTGMASIQCMYAPEFNSHSESFELEVR
ncbi:MAG: alpha-2-macroglobulin family protein [Phycisphaerales bacterium]